MAWTDPSTRSDGDLVTQSIWNTDVVDNLAYLIAKIEPDTLTNQSGGDAAAGDVVIVDGSNDNSFTTTTTANDPLVAGVVMEAITDGAAGRVATGGVITVKVQGNVTRGHYLATSTTAGRAKDAGAAKTYGVFGIALTAYGGGGAGTVTALVIVSAVTGKLPANVVLFTTDGAAPTGFSEYTAARGIVIVGLPNGGTNEGTVGSALTDLADVSHTHTMEYPYDHTHTIDYSTTAGSDVSTVLGSSDARLGGYATAFVDTGSVDNEAHTMPYIQLMAIQRD